LIRNFNNLKIWNRSRAFVKKTYTLTKDFPKEELVGLTSQLKRADISVPSNIAEGCGKGTEKDLNRFLDIAISSSCEIETQLYLAIDLDFINQKVMELMTDEIKQIRKMMIAYQRTVKI
jgi:four helix bundle protein